MQLRDYQQHGIESTIAATVFPLCLVYPMGAGKSHVISGLAHHYSFENKKVLCLVATGKNSSGLIKQNYAKYTKIAPASILCGKLNQKCFKEQVIFASPLTALNHLETVLSYEYSAIIIDECHCLSDTVLEVINAIPNARIIGLTATPYRPGTGYIYETHYKKGVMQNAINPFFKWCAYEISAKELIEQGYLTPPLIANIEVNYPALELELKNGKFDQNQSNKIFSDDKKTILICKDIVERTKDRRGVLIYANSIEHAKRVLGYIRLFSNERAEIVYGNSPNRKEFVEGEDSLFNTQQIKFIVNVDVLTTGADFPHLDAIAFMRATESAGLFQQMLGRSTRLFPGKINALILDYAENIARFELATNLFTPSIYTKKESSNEQIEVNCPECKGSFLASARPNPNKYAIKNGYWADLKGDIIEPLISAHMARRCQAQIAITDKPRSKEDFKQCEYRFSSKECPQCKHLNDITSRYCEQCRFELVDPNNALTLNQIYNAVGQKTLRVLKYKIADKAYYYKFRWRINVRLLLEDKTIVRITIDENKADTFVPPARVTLNKEGDKWIVVEKHEI